MNDPIKSRVRVAVKAALDKKAEDLSVLAVGKPLSLKLADCMTPDPVTVQAKEPIGAAVRRMEEGGYRHLPVVEGTKPVGLLSVKRIVHYLAEHFPGTVYNLPPDPGAVQKQPEGA